MSYDKNQWRESNFYILGPDPFARRVDGSLLNRIQTFYPDDRIIISAGACHSDQRLEYYDYLDAVRALQNQERLSEDQRDQLSQRSIALIVTEDEDTGEPIVYFREEGNAELVQEGLNLLREILPKRQVMKLS